MLQISGLLQPEFLHALGEIFRVEVCIRFKARHIAVSHDVPQLSVIASAALEVAPREAMA